MNLVFPLILFIICFYSRIWVRLKKKDFGVDTWYFLNYAQAFREKKALPVRLDNYLLDIEEQWYPPVLALLLSIFPKKLADKYHWVFSALIDSLQGLLLYVFSFLLTRRFDVAIAAFLLYTSSTMNASMATNLNARPLASLILTSLMLAIYYFSISPNALLFILILFIGAILLHTHKMATQQFVFFCAGFSLLFMRLTYLYILLSIFLCAIILSGGFYLKILKNNIEIVRFWAKNLPYLLKHQVYASSLYKNVEKAEKKIGVSGLKTNKLMFLFARGQLVIYLAIIAAFYFTCKNIPQYNNLKFLFFWVFINYFTVISTSYCPVFKNIGEGFKYLVYGTFPTSLLVAYGLIANVKPVFLSYLVLTALIILSFYVQIFTLRRQLLNVNSYLDDELKSVISIIKESDKDKIACIPVSKAEPIAYLTGKKVLWGAHGSGWDKMDEFWPIIKIPLEKFFQKYNINQILIDKRFVDVEDLRITDYIRTVFDGSFYILADIKQNIRVK